MFGKIIKSKQCAVNQIFLIQEKINESAIKDFQPKRDVSPVGANSYIFAVGCGVSPQKSGNSKK